MSPPAAEQLLFGASGNMRRRRAANRAMEIAAWTAALLAVSVLALVIASIAVKGAGEISLGFLTGNTQSFGAGGIGNAIVGSAIIVGIATAIAVPLGILVGIYTSEFAGPRSGFLIRYVLDILNGVPTIVTAIFVFGLLVVPLQSQSGYAGSIALAIVMLPLVARSCHEVLVLVPGTVKEAGLALGASRWRTTVSVVLPTALSGMVTGALLAVARAIGETAPLLLTTSVFADLVQTDPNQALPNIPVTILKYSESPEPTKHAEAWGAALVLIAFVLLISVVARSLSARTRRRLDAAR